MNYEQLFAFVAFAEQLNFTRAARELHISQPALHVQVKKLAESVGRPLYRRVGRALVLTAEGRRLAAYGREVETRGQSVLAELRGEVTSGPVVLASGQGAFQYLLGPAIRRFPKQRWPLRLLAMPGPQAVLAVAEARAHLAVAAEAAPADLAVTHLRKVGQKVVVPTGHRLARKRSLKPADLRGEKLVVAPVGSPHRTMLAQLLGGIDVAVEVTGWELMLEFSRNGVGVAVVNDFCPAPAGTVGIPLLGAPSATYSLIERPGLSSPGIAALRALIVELV